MNTAIPIDETIETALRDVIDPEVGLNVVDLGLIYGIEVTGNNARIDMTMTTPSCPMTDYLVDCVTDTALRQLPEDGAVDVRLVWDPLWSPDMISPEGKNLLGW